MSEANVTHSFYHLLGDKITNPRLGLGLQSMHEELQSLFLFLSGKDAQSVLVKTDNQADALVCRTPTVQVKAFVLKGCLVIIVSSIATNNAVFEHFLIVDLVDLRSYSPCAKGGMQL